MPRRRIIGLILLLIGISVAMSLFAQRRTPETSKTETSRTSTTDPEIIEPSGGERTLKASINVDRKNGSRAEPIRVKLGQRVVLSVASSTPDQVEVSGYGLIKPVSDRASARFDFIADIPGKHKIKLLDAGSEIGLLIVKAPSK